jgi:phage terminase small subunit
MLKIAYLVVCYGVSRDVSDNLLPGHARFIDEYMVDLNATQAAIRAGYSPTSARTTGSDILLYPGVQAEIDRRNADFSARASISKEKLISWLKFVQTTDFTEAFTLDFELKNRLDIPAELRALIQGVTVIKKSTKHGEDIHIRVSFPDKMRAAELLARHLGMFDAKESGQGFTLIVNAAVVQAVDTPMEPVNIGAYTIDLPIEENTEKTSS